MIGMEPPPTTNDAELDAIVELLGAAQSKLDACGQSVLAAHLDQVIDLMTRGAHR